MKNNGGIRLRSIYLLFTLFILVIISVGCRKNGTTISICDLQGSGVVSPYYGHYVSVTGIVSADLQDISPGGFYIQNEDCQHQNKINVSKGIFILAEHNYDLVALGDEVTLRGYVVEYSQETYLILQEDSLRILSVENPIPETVDLQDVLQNSGPLSNYEPWEGMLVFLSNALVMPEPDTDGNIMILPMIGGIANQENFDHNNRVGLLSISLNKPHARLGSAQEGDILEDLLAVLRQNGNSYQLQILDPDRVKLKPVKNQPDNVASEEDLFDNTFSDQDPSSTLLPTGTPTPYPVNLLLVEIFPNPIGDEPEGEWIEIYNPDLYAIPLTGIKIGDEPSQGGKEGMLVFPDGYFIEANEVLVIANNGSEFKTKYGILPDFEMEDSNPLIPDLLPYEFWGGEKVQLSNSGDEVILLDPWDQIVDGIAYGNSKALNLGSLVQIPREGHSLERYPPERDRDKASDWREQSGGSPGRLDRSLPTQVVPPSSSPKPTQTPSPSATHTPTRDIPSATPVWVELLLSEIMFNPSGAEPGGEWFEIFNPEINELPLTGVKVGDAAYPGDPEGMFMFPDGELIPPGGIILIAHQSNLFESRYGFKPDFELINTDPVVKELESYTDWASGSIRLGNQGDELILLNGWNELVDSLPYGDSVFNIFQPAVPIGPEGSSLARYPMTNDNDLAEDWMISENPSPGMINPGFPSQTPSSSPTLPAIPTSTLANSLTPIPPTKTPEPTTIPSSTITPSATMESILTPTGTDPIPTSSTTVIPASSPTGANTPLPSLTHSQSPSPTITVAISTHTPTLVIIEDELFILNEIHADPHPVLGDANNDGSVHSDDDEFLEFINIGESDLDLNGWEIQDAVKTRWVFPAHTILSANSAILIFGGGIPSGDFGGSLVQVTGSLGLNNTGDTIAVLDETGTLRIRIYYGSEGNQNQSLTRNPDLIGSLPFFLHSNLSAANGSLFSPGTKIDGTRFGE